jgi:glycosyltransferase involved in cell wall biosynthesis
MIIGIDGIPLQGNRTRVGRYVAGLLDGLSEVLEQDKAFVWMNNPQPGERGRVRENRLLEVVETRFPLAALRMSWGSLGTPTLETLLGRPVDVALHPNFLPLPQKRGAKALFVHDLTFLTDPSLVPPQAAKTLARDLPKHLRECALVLTPSGFAQAQVLRHFPELGDRKVRVVPHGLEEAFRRPSAPEVVRDLRMRLALDRPYFLHVGTLEPGKNLLRLVHAFLVFKQSHRTDHQLVLAGPLGWVPEDFMGFIRSPALASIVRWMDYVPESDLPALYTGADAFLYPALREGFGSPVLEAMGCGVPVVCSNTGALPEIAGEAAYLLDPVDIAQWAEVMGKIVREGSLAEELRSRGLKQAARFQWETAARRTLEAFEEAARSDA